MLSIEANKIEKYNHVSNISIALHKHSTGLKAEQGKAVPAKLSPGLCWHTGTALGPWVTSATLKLDPGLPKNWIHGPSQAAWKRDFTTCSTWEGVLERREVLVLTETIIYPSKKF